MLSVRFLPEELEQIQTLLSELASDFDAAEDPACLREVALRAQELPRRIRAQLLDFKLREPVQGVLVLSGYPVDDRRIGATPASWSTRSTPSSTLREELFLLLLGTLLGDSIAWSTQQDGHLVHDILPMPGCEHEQLGCGSEELLWWHTEDAFHPYRGDYLGMMCLRNPDGVATTVGSLAGIEIAPAHRDVLFEPRFTIRPDESHLPKNNSRPNPGAELQSAFQRIEEQWNAPAKIPVFFGAKDSPYLRLDLYFMDRLVDDPEAQKALDTVAQTIDRNLQELVLRPGDVCFIDNFRAVHGRKPFKAHYNGRDRWLKRINIVRDLRKSRDGRAGCESRLLR